MNDALLASLLDPAAYPEPTGGVLLKQTHISYLFFTDSHVYKVKKPVNFGFLDFSTIDRRRFYCNEEVRLNSRLSPEIYEGVVDLREEDGAGRFFGHGNVVDHAVKMRRLPEERMLARLIQRDEVTGDDIRKIARLVAEFHAGAERGPEVARYGTAEAIRALWEENLAQAAEAAAGSADDCSLPEIRQAGHRFLDERCELLERRHDAGFIREGDGDLHTENICIAAKIHIFDCIEFSARLRCCDTGSDLGFLLMDLDFRRRPDLGEILLEEYLAASADRDLPALLPFYKAHRAVVRGKVEALRLRDPQIPDEERKRSREDASRHFRLARSYLLPRRHPLSLVITCGLSGSGKSAVAEELAGELGTPCISSDRTRKRLAGIAPTERRPAPEGAGIYSREFDGVTYRELLEKASEELSRGRSVVVDATFRRRADRDAFGGLARAKGAAFFIVETRCPDAVLEQRLRARLLDPLAVSDAGPGLLPAQQANFQWPHPGEGTLVAIDTTEPIRHNVASILHLMESS